MSRPSVSEPARETPVARETEVLVCGGGPAGIAAAIASAASGAKTVLLESAGCLGGIWTAGLLSFILDPKLESPVSELIVAELDRRGAKSRRVANAELEKTYQWAQHSYVYDPEVMKRVLEAQLLRHGVEVQLYTRVCGVQFAAGAGKRIDSVFSESPSGREAWKANVIIDATGNGDVGYQAGCRYQFGRPESGESQPMTLMCLISSPYPERLAPYSWGAKTGKSLISELHCRGTRPSYGSPILLQIQPTLFAFMMNHQYGDGRNAADQTGATFRARAEIHEIVDTLREQGGDWEGVRVIATADQIGIREGRRLQGLYEVTKEDLISGKKHPDGICEVHFPVDVHSTRKEGGVPFDEENKIKSQPYDIPLRAIIAADVENLLMAGRCISGDFIAHSSYRVTGNSIALGEAAGCLAAVSTRHGLLPKAVSWEQYQSASHPLKSRLQGDTE